MTALGATIKLARNVDLLDLARRYVTLKKIAASEYAGPCPRCGGTDRFNVNPVKRTFLCRNCADGCDFRAALERLGSLLPAAPIEPARRAEAASPDEEHVRNLRSAARIISQIRPIADSPVALRYLREVREIDVDAIADVLGEVDSIGWRPSVYLNEPGHGLNGKRLGAIVAILTDPLTAKPRGAISRTYITPDLKKIGKAKSLAGSGIARLSRNEDVLEGLHICEGLESALYGLSIGFRPIWSTGSTSQLRAFPVLPGISQLTVFADRDPNGAGEAAALEVKARWGEADSGEVRLRRLRNGFGDLNDLANGEGG
jgi:hypothetical protein